MMLNTAVLVLAAASVAHAAKTIVVTVGGPRITAAHATLPRIIDAAVGDVVSFTFHAEGDDGLTTANHSIVQTSADKPCTPLKGGFSSPFGVAAGATFSILIEDASTPIYYACGATLRDVVNNHCQAGEVGVINPSMVGIDMDTTHGYDAQDLVVLATQQPLDGAMDGIPRDGSPIGSGVGARVLGTYTPGHAYTLPPNIYPSSSASPSSVDPDIIVRPLITPSASASSSDESYVGTAHTGLSAGAIAGIVLGSVGALALLLAALFVVRRTQLRKRKEETTVFGAKVDRSLAVREVGDNKVVQPAMEV